ncbi:MAG: DMT family transporter [Ignavibacteriales bacterium]|nr:DMT family transporter [Ignavibacteriales bacterium]
MEESTLIEKFHYQKNIVYSVLFFQQLIAGGTHIVAKVVVKDINPVSLTMLRSVMAAAGLYLLVKLRGTKLNFRKEDFRSIIILSFLAIPVNQFLFLYAIKLTTPSNTALLYSTTPAIVLVISNLTGMEKAVFKKNLGIVIPFIGILIVIFERGIDFRSEYKIGHLILVFAVTAWAWYTVKGKSMIPKYGAFKTSAATMIFGTLMFIPVGVFDVVQFDYSALTIHHWGGLFYLAFGTSIFAYLLWYYAHSRIEATKVAIFANLQPVLTTILSVLLLGQIITSGFITGGIVTLI